MAYYPTNYPTHCYGSVGLFGLSAGEAPNTSVYETFGVGGTCGGANDGGSFSGQQPVVVPHYAAMISGAQEAAASTMFSWLESQGLFTPWNNVESLFVSDRNGCTGISWNELRGSWNLGLQTLGLVPKMAKAAGIDHPLHTAFEGIQSLKNGYSVLGGCANARLDFSPGQIVPLDTPVSWRQDTCIAASLQVYQDGKKIADSGPEIHSGAKTLRDLAGDLDGSVEVKLWTGASDQADAVFVTVTRSGPLQFVESYEGDPRRFEQVSDQKENISCAASGGRATPITSPGAPDGQRALRVWANPDSIAGGKDQNGNDLGWNDHVIWGIKVATSPLAGPSALSVWSKIPSPTVAGEAGQSGPEFSLQETRLDSDGHWRTYEAGIQYQPQASTWAVWQQLTDTQGQWVPLPQVTLQPAYDTWYQLTLEFDLDL